MGIVSIIGYILFGFLSLVLLATVVAYISIGFELVYRYISRKNSILTTIGQFMGGVFKFSSYVIFIVLVVAVCFSMGHMIVDWIMQFL